MYARISLSLQNEFQSKHALALYELFVDYLHEDTRYGETPFVSIQDFRKLMGIPEGMYPEFKKLSKWVIKDPLAEINNVTDLAVTVEYKKEGKAVVAVKFRIRRTLQLPESHTAQKDLFPEEEEVPAVVQELLAAGLAREDALDIWQRGAAYVEASFKPEPETFDSYIREKIHLLKRRQASGVVKNSTGFLLDALKKNYANPEFAKEQEQKEAQQHAQARKTRERAREAFERQKEQVRHRHGEALHAHWTRIIEASPGLLNEAVTALHETNATFWRANGSGETSLEDYRQRPTVYVFVEEFLARRYPEHFQELAEAHHAELAALDEKIVASAQAV
jgi:hypothetical protein